MQTDGLIEALKARLDEDERMAHLMPPFPWKQNDKGDEVVAADGELVCEPFALNYNQTYNMTRYFVDNDPSQKLAIVAAHREILDRHTPEHGTSQLPFPRIRCSYCWQMDREGEHGDYGTGREWPCPDIVSLAKGYGVEP